jgi:hypothetical protein
MPRLFGHALFASPEPIAAFFGLWSVATIGRALDEEDGPAATFAWTVWAAVTLGLALLCKLTAVLIPLGAGLALLARRELGRLPLLIFWGVLGTAAFIGGWPWLWPIDIPGQAPGWEGMLARTRDFLATGADRSTIYTWYLGKQFAGNELPWHYVWTIVGVTTPPATLALALAGIWRASRSATGSVLVGWVIATLAVFSLPIQRYDGERLFLFIFPPLAILAGIGAGFIASKAPRGWARAFVQVAFWAALAMPISVMARLQPCELSFYSIAIDGPTGAEKLGFEATYWGDSLTTEFLERCAARCEHKEMIPLLPTLYAPHAARLSSTTMAAKEQQATPGDWLKKADEIPKDWEKLGEAKRAIVFRRQGYLVDPKIAELLAQSTTLEEVAREGVWLSRLVELPRGWALAKEKPAK